MEKYGNLNLIGGTDVFQQSPHFPQFKCKLNIQVTLYWLPLLGFMPQNDINIKLSASTAYILPVIVYSSK